MNPTFVEAFFIVVTVVSAIFLAVFIYGHIEGESTKRWWFITSLTCFIVFLFFSIITPQLENSVEKIARQTRLFGRFPTTKNPSDKKYYVRVEKKWLSLENYSIQVDSIGQPDSVYVYSTIPRKFLGFLNADFDSLPNYFLRKEQDIILEGNYSEAEMK